MVVFYHSDHDGIMSAAIVKKYFKGEGRYIKVGHVADFPLAEVKPDEKVVIVDFSVTTENGLSDLYEITEDIIWIDHHISAINKDGHFVDSGKIRGLLSVEKAACELTWDYFFPSLEMPYSVKLIGDHDVWKFAYGDDTRFFQSGLYLHDSSLESGLWEPLLDSKEMADKQMALIIKEGEIVYQFRNLKDRSDINSYGYPVDFEGYKAIACNVKGNSYLFEGVKEKYDLFLSYIYTGTQYKVSLFTPRDDIDLSEIVAKYGGGGHRKAAGFRTQKLPF